MPAAEPELERSSTVNSGGLESDGGAIQPDPLSETVSFHPAPRDAATGAVLGLGHLPPGMPAITNYELLGLLGRGGMGFVVMARQRTLDRLVAIKMPLGRRASGYKRFLKGAHAAARLRHPNICAIHEVGEVDERPFIVMDFIRGNTLGEWAQMERPNARRCAEIMATLSRAVGYAHQHGVIHRDLKPANVMLDAESGQPVLMDFGLAKEMTLDASQFTMAGQVIGTPAYMAPEQAAGQVERIGPATDIYALGAILYALLTGQPPFSGGAGEVLMKVQSAEPTTLRKLLPHIHRDIETICMKAMAKSPEERYGSAVELAEDLERFCAGEAIVARRRGLLARMARAVARRPVLSAVVAAAVLAMMLGGILLVRGQQERRTASLLASLETDFDAGDWSAARLEEMDRAIEQLQHRAPVQANSAQQRLVQRFAAGIEEQLKHASLGPEQVAQIEASLALLADRDPQRAADLRKAFQRRMQTWETVFHLNDPFASLETVFDPAEVKAQRNALVRLSGDPSKPSLTILTRVASRGIVRFEIALDESWDRARQVGVGLGVTAGEPEAVVARGARRNPQAGMTALRGYQFLLRDLSLEPSVADRSRPPGCFAASRRSGGQISIEILHDAARLRTMQVDAARLPPGPLRLMASKAGDQLQFIVGDLPPLEFLDAFGSGGAAAGVFALDWPTEAKVLDLRALRQAVPESPSPLERGDSLYASGVFAPALAAYEEQARAYVSAEIGQQVRYKEALCLLALRRGKEAEPLLERLAGESGGRWPAMAACRLWLELVRQKRFDQTDAIFDSLSARYRFEQLVTFVPEQSYGEIVRGYAAQAMGTNAYKPHPALIAQCERAVAIAKLFQGENALLNDYVVQALLRAYRFAGQEEQALRSAERLFRGVDAKHRDNSLHNAMTEYLWLLRVAGQPQRALDEVDRLIAAGATRDDWVLDRVRDLHALGRSAEAEQALDAWLAGAQASANTQAKTEKPEMFWCEACAIRGSLRDRRGDHAGALQDWKNGTEVPWARFPYGFATLFGLINASLADAMTENDAREILEAVCHRSQGSPYLSLLDSSISDQVFPLKTITAVLRDAFRSPRGRALAEKIVFQADPYTLCIEAPPQLMAYEWVRQGCLASALTPAQDELLWQMAGESYRAVLVTGKLGKPQVLQLLLTWKGMTNFFGWGGVAPSLAPGLRGKIAYFLGHRYLRLGHRDDAAMFFRTALTDAANDSSLKTLAAKELEALAPPHAPSKEPGKNAPHGSQRKN
jgi:tetratricopeptide (TPR) repeat protein